MSLAHAIKEKRPNLADSSVKTYNSILTNLHKKVFGNKEIEIKDFGNTKEILAYLKDVAPSVRKTTLSALFILSQESVYRELMGSDIEKYNDLVSLKELSPEQQEEWLNPEQIKKLFDTYKKTADLLYRKDKLTMNDLQAIQNFIIVCLYSGLFIPPRRALDYAEFKIRNAQKNQDNYQEKDKFIFNKFKTAKYEKEDQKSVSLPRPLKTILAKWEKKNPTDWLLFDNKGNKLTSVKINQRLQRIFGNKIGINMLRKMYLTNKYENYNRIQQDLAKDMGEMGSSTQQADHYVLNL